MWSSLLGTLALLVVALPVLPLPGMRQRALNLVHRTIHGFVLAFVGLAGFLFLFPHVTPALIATHVGPTFSEWSRVLHVSPQSLWIAAAALVVTFSLPILVVIEFAYRLSFQTAIVGHLLEEIRRQQADKVGASSRPRSREVRRGTKEKGGTT